MLEITIKGARYTPKWDTLQTAVREMIHPDGDSDATLVKISRPDNKCGYREPGVYELNVRVDGDIMPLKLTVEN